jgi:ribosomal protein L17
VGLADHQLGRAKSIALILNPLATLGKTDQLCARRAIALQAQSSKITSAMEEKRGRPECT